MMPDTSDATLRAAGLAIGIGMGGFADGILFHQILQLHNMLSARIPTDDLVGAKVNMMWDGVFHGVVWVAVAVGIALLWRAAKRQPVLSAGVFTGSILMGWGLFNVVEGVVDHHILGLHHVYERAGRSIWDYAFLAWGALMIAGGHALRRRNSDRASSR